ncbi:MAG: nucleoside hydrolase [Bacteroidales bacterium]|nr:nucleoside hydrolase [Bacteroidales bacterium]
MIKKVFVFTLILFHFFVLCQASPIHDEDDHPLVIDTDCAFDDMRGIGMLLSCPGINIQGIVVTEGTLLPEEGVMKIRSVLHEFSLDTLPVTCGMTFNRPGPAWREFNRSITWGDQQQESNPTIDAVEWLQKKLETCPDKITYICLGPLSTLAKVLTLRPELKKKIYRIIWYNESIEPSTGFNYTYDKSAADFMISMEVRIDLISKLNKEQAFWDTDLYTFAGNYNTTLATLLSKTGNQPNMMEIQHKHHLRMADELVSAYYLNPELFDITIMHPRVYIRFNRDYDLASVKEVFADMIRGSYKKGNTVVFSAFPDKPEMYTYDVREIMDSTIARYGPEEWKACVMTDEFHGHLGSFSIIGAKMGIKARELFGVGPDILMVTSYAGVKPPYSCMNDGIQVSTGATIGQGLITIAAAEKNRPEAIFTYQGRSIRLKLKDSYLEMVDKDIAEGIVKFGLTDDGYWKMVRRSALKYWMEWDRNVIFEVEETNNNN